MGLKKGNTNNPHGRPPGKPNRVTKELRETIKSVLDEEMTPAKLKKTLAALDPEKRLNLLIKLLDFVIPKLKQTDLTLDIDKLSDNELNTIINHLLTEKNSSDENS